MAVAFAEKPSTTSYCPSKADCAVAEWSYEEAFCRNLGLISRREQEKLRNSRVAIAGMGGVGGVHLLTLARLGIGKFTIADPDVFELANFNRQAGANIETIGQNKAELMAAESRRINPEIEINVFAEPITRFNVAEFLADADLFVDGVDFFSIGARRLLFSEARQRKIWSFTAAPLGFSTAWLAFDPLGMSFDEYFDLHSQQTYLDQLVAFAVGLAPRPTHVPYLDYQHVDIVARRGPSSAAACQLASGVTGSTVVKLLLDRGSVRPAPHYHQFDAYRAELRSGRLLFANRHPIQRIKRWWLKRWALAQGAVHASGAVDSD
jgi:hypothetical protein